MSIISDKPKDEDREIDEFGEIAVKRIKQVQKRLSPDEIDLIIATYQSGESVSKLARRFNHSKSTISNQLKKHGIHIRGK